LVQTFAIFALSKKGFAIPTPPIAKVIETSPDAQPIVNYRTEQWMRTEDANVRIGFSRD
jgi:hypothetical protein